MKWAELSGKFESAQGTASEDLENDVLTYLFRLILLTNMLTFETV